MKAGMKLIIAVGLVAVAIGAILYFSLRTVTEQQEKPPIRIGYNLWPGYACLLIADEKGYFAEEAVKVKTVLYSDNAARLYAFSNNELDGHFVLLTDLLVLHSQGVDAKIVFLTDTSNGGDVIIARKDIHTIGDLKGKKIAVSGINSFSHIWVLAVLEANGLEESDVQFANVNAKDVPQALASGEIDAGHIWEPFLSQTTNAQNHILAGATTKDVPGIITDGLAFHSGIIKQRADDIDRVIRALNRGVHFLRTNPQEAHTIVSEKLGMDIESAERFFQDAKVFDVEDNKQLLRAGSGLAYKDIESISKFLLKRGQLFELPDFDDLIEQRFVNNPRNSNIEVNGKTK